MPVAIAFIRGINVGGNHALPMATLRSLCEDLGWNDVGTHIQSGNVVFRCPARALVGAATKLESAIEKARGFRPSVVLRTLADLREIVLANPFAGREPSKLLVLFLSDRPDASAPAALRALKPDPEEIVLRGRDVFLHYPNGIGTSKLQFTAIEKVVKASGTTRNWNTVSRMLAMAEALDAAN